MGYPRDREENKLENRGERRWDRKPQEGRSASRVVGGSPRGPRKPREDDDKGTVLTCTKCRLGFFSRWEAPEGFDPENPVVPEKHQVCERCVSNRIFDKNMAILAKN